MIPLTYIWVAFAFLMALSVILMGRVLRQKKRHQKAQKRIQLVQNYVFERYIQGNDVPNRYKPLEVFEAFIHVVEHVHINETMQARFHADVLQRQWVRFLKRQASSRFAFKRQRAVTYLGYINTQEAHRLLCERLLIERNEIVYFYIVNALKKRLDVSLMSSILTRLPKLSTTMIQRLTTLLLNQSFDIDGTFDVFKDHTHPQIILFFITYAQRYPSSTLLAYVRKQFETFDTQLQHTNDALATNIRRRAGRVLVYLNDDLLRRQSYLHHKDPEVVSFALANIPHKVDALDVLLSYVEKDIQQAPLIKAFETLFQKQKMRLDDALTRLEENTLTPKQKQLIILAMASQLDTLVFKALNAPKQAIFDVLTTLLKAGQYTPFIRFLNHNKNPHYEFECVNLIRAIIQECDGLEEELALYAKESVLKALNIPRKVVLKPVKETPKKELKKLRYLRRLGVFSLLLVPLVFIVELALRGVTVWTWDLVPLFILRYNYYIVSYYVAVNLIYLTLIFLSHQAANDQMRRWKLKFPSLLYEDRLLPAISILAPAYNEALSIVDSVQSLLNLTYPRYEVIVINDGSTDDTLKTLIQAFHLERHAFSGALALPTQAILGVYKTPKIPNLMVIDKRNGGKADALNVGINLATFDHVCGIDADSVLESDALLKMTSAQLDGEDALAMGGHIHPSNGSMVVKGVLEARGLGRLPIERLQTLEYVRAFTTGRLGWSKLNSLLIISGAFGLFKKAPLVEAGGYMTSASILKKDTVGEDMEVVVRMRKNAYQDKHPHRVMYLYQAGCHTQVPDTWSTLLKQRNRWHRGLIDILTYHKDMMLRIKYRGVGMFAFPYFLLFEMFGPLLEIQGYVFLILGFALGILPIEFFLAFFIATIGLGMVVSLTSVLMLEKDQIHFNKRDTWRLVFYAIVENFGYRQWMSLYRVRGYFSALKETHEWGEQRRKGFK